MATTQSSYLIIRCLSENVADVEPYLEEAADITVLHKTTLKQKFTGTSLEVLKAGSDKTALLDMSRDMSKMGIMSAVVSRDELKLMKKPVHVKGLEISTKSITFLSANQEPLIKLDGRQKCLIVLGTIEFSKIIGKRLARKAMGVDTPLSLSQVLRLIYQSRPVMDVFVAGSDTPYRFDSMRFNYSSLGELGKNAVTMNFPIMLREIKRHSGAVLLDTGFGENTLPFLSEIRTSGGKPTREDFLKQFSIYSRFIMLATMKNIYAAKTKAGVVAALPLIGELGGIVWGGPMLALAVTGGVAGSAMAGMEAAVIPGMIGMGGLPGQTVAGKKQTRVESAEKPLGAKEQLTHFIPPPGAVVHHYGGFSISRNLLGFHTMDLKSSARSLGPPIITGPLTFIIIGSLISARFLESLSPLSITMLSAGLLMFTHAFVLLQRKRAIENCPTSKIKTMPMGEVEVNGITKSKYFMKSPISYTDCVYYSYKVYKRIRTRNGYQNVLVEWGHSGKVPFYLEDDTGKTLVIPNDAVVHAGRKETYRGQSVLDFFAASSSRSSIQSNKTVEETVIATGSRLYVTGYAHRTKISSEQAKKDFNEKLRALKANKNKMAEYDTDFDGKISEEEWDVAVKDMEQELLDEKLRAEKKDEIAIGAHPTGGLFYISDKHEDKIIRSMSWKAPLFFVLGIAAITGGIFFIHKLWQADIVNLFV